MIDYLVYHYYLKSSLNSRLIKYFVSNLLTAKPGMVLSKECVESIIVTNHFTIGDHNFKS